MNAKLLIRQQNYFLHHKSSDMSRKEEQHYLDIITATTSKATPTQKCAIHANFAKRSVICAKHMHQFGSHRF